MVALRLWHFWSFPKLCNLRFKICDAFSFQFLFFVNFAFSEKVLHKNFTVREHPWGPNRTTCQTQIEKVRPKWRKWAGQMWKNGPAKNKNQATQNKKPRKIFPNFAFRKFRKICGYPAQPQRKIQKIGMRKIKNGRPKIKKWAAKNEKAADPNPKTPAPNLKRAGPKSLPGCSPCPLGAPGMFPYGEVSVKWLKPKCEISKK